MGRTVSDWLPALLEARLLEAFVSAERRNPGTL